MLFEMIHLVRAKAGYACMALLSARGLSPFAPSGLQIRGYHPGRGGGAHSTDELIVFLRLLGQGQNGMDGLVLGQSQNGLCFIPGHPEDTS
jgi:hypothetical protein